MKKKILITGGAGFVGSNLALFLKKHLKDTSIICLDNLSRKGSALNISRLKNQGISFIKGDIRYRTQLLKFPKVDCILECSAEPSVLAGYDNPDYTIDTNLLGTLNCLHLAKRDRADFIFLSSSRVYPIEPLNQIPFVELPARFDWKKNTSGAGYSYEGINMDFPLSGTRSLYGATKLCSEYLIEEFRAMYGLKTVINRLGVISGPWQMGRIDQGIVGFWVIQHMLGNSLSYIGYKGSGKQLRDCLHVDDVCDLILYQLRNLSKYSGRTFTAGGGRKNTFSLQELTSLVQTITDKEVPIKRVPEMRKGDLRIYFADNSEISKHTGWAPKRNLEEIVEDIYEWVLTHKDILKKTI